MAKMYFKYGTMNAAKSANLLMAKHNYEEQGMKVLLLKPAIDTRDGCGKVKSRIGLSSECMMISGSYDIRKSGWEGYDVLIIDEAQFLTEEQAEQAHAVSCSIPVLCYGLMTDYRQRLFPGSRRLVELAEKLERIKSVCSCGKAANYTVRIGQDGKLATEEAEQAVIGGNYMYRAVCKDCLIRMKKEGGAA